jgi:hypothetical protein
MWPTFIFLGALGGLTVTTWRRTGISLAVAAFASIVGAMVTGEVVTAPLIAANTVVGLVFGALTRNYVRFARRLWNAT